MVRIRMTGHQHTPQTGITLDLAQGDAAHMR
jgi:hypothetical protein